MGIVREYLQDGIEEGSRAMIWPFPNTSFRDEEYEWILEDERFDEIAAAVGKEPGLSTKRFHEYNERTRSLDQEKGSGITSKEVAGEVARGRMNSFDYEFARDVAMDFLYAERGDITESERSEEIAQDSVDILDGEGDVIYDLHDFGSYGLYSVSDIEEIVKKEDILASDKVTLSNRLHAEMFVDSVEPYFEDVEILDDAPKYRFVHARI